MGTVSVALSGYDSTRAESFLRDVADRLRRAPGAQAVSYTDYVPLSLGCRIVGESADRRAMRRSRART